MKKWEKVRSLYKKGVPIRQIARDMDMSRNTVRRWIRSEEKPRYRRRDYYPTKIDEYKEQIKKWYLENGYIGAKTLIKKHAHQTGCRPVE